MRSWKLAWVLVVMGVSLAGCSSRAPVDDGACVQDADCGPTQLCERATRQCVDREDPTPGCTADSDCIGGYSCDTATGQCKVKPGRSLSCEDAADCLASELCHPQAKVCVQTCVSGADCPDSAKTCDVLSATEPQKVCKCSTDALCNEGRSTFELVCSSPHSVCAPKCTADAQCATGEVCDTGTGRCKVWGGSGAPCTGEGQSTCDYGTHHCSSGICTPLPAPTCQNYENFQDKYMLGTTGTIFYRVRRGSVTTDTAACGTATPQRWNIALSAYSSQAFPATKDGLAGLFRVKVDGSLQSGVNLIFPGNNYTVLGEDRKRAEIVVSLCMDASITTLSTAFYFTEGNFLCQQVHF